MPSTIVHSYFVKDVLDILPDKIRTKLNADRCRMFGQSVDSLMFYNLRISQILSLAIFIIFGSILVWKEINCRNQKKKVNK